MIETDNKKPLVITIIVLIIIILALGGFIAVDKLVLNKKEEETLTTIDDVEINLNAMYQISESLNRLDHTFNDPKSNFFGYIYREKKLEAKRFDPLAALFLAMHDDMIPSNTNQFIVGEKVKNNFERIFGKAIKYSPSTINAGDTYQIIYDQATNRYSYVLPVLNPNYQSGLVSYTIRTTLKDGNVIVERKVFYVEYSNETTANIYKKSDKAQLLGTLNLKKGILNPEEVVGKYGSKITTYEYTFKQNTADNYTFDSIKRK